jgi:DNA-binding NarL/FixJ family response regulator
VLSAAELYHDHGQTLWRGAALEDAATLLALGGHVRDARARYRDAVDVYLQLDAAADLARADARLGEFGLRRRDVAVRRRPAAGWEALTPRERVVAELVAEGLSNPDIGTRLSLSRRTVQVHVSHILAKLAARSRVEITREVTLRNMAGAQSRTA